MQPEWNLHYFRWVIDDGEPERHVGEVFDWFSVSFWFQASLVRTEERLKTATPISDNAYRVIAEVVYVSQDPSQGASIIDFGIQAISDSAVVVAGCQPGDHVAGEIALELPLCTKLAPHQLARRWQVNRISADLTPYVPHPVYGRAAIIQLFKTGDSAHRPSLGFRPPHDTQRRLPQLFELHGTVVASTQLPLEELSSVGNGIVQ